VHSNTSSSSLSQEGIEVIGGDLDAPESVKAGMAGCDQLFLLSPPHPDQSRREIAVIEAARAAGVRHVVAVSIMGADASSPVNFASWHAEIDDYLMGSGLGYTILRPAGFMQVHLWPETVASQGRWYGTTGDGTHAFIDARDIAEVAAHALASPQRDSGVHEITGPEAISMPQAAASMAEALKHPVEYVDIPADHFASALTAAGLPDYVAEGIISFYQGIRAGHAATVTHSVQEVTGSPARSYHQFAETTVKL
jgi:uncharacterized protein YbjT (DUF2867 family)